MSTLAGSGEMTPAQLAARVLPLSVFHRISREDYKILLRHLLETEQLQRTETGGLIVGLAGERQTNSFKFYAVFQENEEYSVRCESQELGTIVKPPPVGEKIALAGHVWTVLEVDHKRHSLYVELVRGKVPAYFGEVAGDIHTHILERMRQILQENTVYPYLRANAVARLTSARSAAFSAQFTRIPLLNLGGQMWCLLPWLGSYAFLALERLIKRKCAGLLGIKGFDSCRPYYIQFTMTAEPTAFFSVLAQAAASLQDPMELVYPDEVPIFEKYDEFIPPELIRKGFAYGVLDMQGMKERVFQWAKLSNNIRITGWQGHFDEADTLSGSVPGSLPL